MKQQLSVRMRAISAAAFVGLALLATSCSDRARKETKEAADAVASDARAGANKAAEKTREASRDIAATAGEAGRDISAGAEKAADKTRAIAQDAAAATRRGAAVAAQAGSDGWITTKVKAKFLDESILKGSDIDVDTTDHVVTLKGTVLSAAGRSRAETIARGTQGVTRVVNQLIVKTSGQN
jgi:osmotically-inducible protein OsmY